MPKLKEFLDRDTTKRAERYAAYAVLLWQLVGPGLENCLRTAIRAEIKPLTEEIASLRQRVASLEPKCE